MSTIVTRSGKGSPLTHTEVDDNFTNLNTDKYQEGSAIGAATPAAGTFTTLTATGQTSLGGAAGANNFRVLGTAGTINYWQAVGGDGATTNPRLSIEGTSTNTSAQFASKGTGVLQFITNGTSNLEQMRVAHTASAVNYVQVTGGATGSSPTISSQGSDANTNLQFNAKGYGSVLFASGPSNRRMFEAVYGTGADANWLRVAGAASSSSPVLSVAGSDTNISQVFQSKGTGAIDLAAGSSGVNISNGGTVTALTQTAGGSAYTSVPTVAISAPTTAGGVQATMSITMSHLSGSTISNGGTGYTVNDVLTIVGGTRGTAAQFTVTSVSGGVVTGITRTGTSTYTVLPSSPSATTGGTGTGCTIAVNWTVNSSLTITNAGSGYVEQPTVSFSGGGGSGAAAYATLGSGTVVKSLGSTMSFSTSGGEQVRVLDTTAANYMTLKGSGSGSAISLGAAGTDGGIATQIFSKGSGTVEFWTNGGNQRQMTVAHTASAVNYVQVTGAATGSNPTISAQGSDTNAGLTLQSKGTFGLTFRNSSNGNIASITHAGSATPNYVQLAATVSGSSPSLNAAGGDTNIDLTLTPKGTGQVVVGGSNGIRVSRVNSSDEGGQLDLCRSSDNAAAWGVDVFGSTSTPSLRFVDNTASATRAELDGSGNFKFNSGYGSAATAYGCRAWVNFNGTGTVAIRASGNVSSITDNGTGEYTVNFTTALPDANYSVVGAVGGTNASYCFNLKQTVSLTTTSCTVASVNPNITLADSAYITVSVFR